MLIKDLFNYALYGAAITAGGMAIRKGVQIAKDPVAKANIKRKFNNVKQALKS